MNPAVILRLVADAALVNAALFLAFCFRVLFAISSGVADTDPLLASFWEFYKQNFVLLTVICVSCFVSFGFYTRGRMYQSRYKIAIIVQAVLAAYGVFIAVSYFSGGIFGLPRGVTLIAAGFTATFLILARLWATAWAAIVRLESKLFPPDPISRPIKKVLVIGGSGYIGSALLPKLLDAGYQVRILDMLLYGSDPIKAHLESPNLELVEADFRQVNAVVSAMQDVDAVVHLGAIVGDPACEIDKELTVEVNLEATRMIAEVAKGCGVSRFVFASTCSVYGAGDEILDENSRLNPVSLYARSKVASEQVLFELANKHFAPTILRFSTIYGFSGRTRFDLVVNLLAAKAMVDKKITVINGHQWRPFLHVDDAAKSILCVLKQPYDGVANQIFNVGSSSENYTIQQVGELVKSLVPDAELIQIESNQDRRNYRVDFSKIENRLGFSCSWTVKSGIEQVIEAMRKRRIDHYEDPKYSNAKFLLERNESKLISAHGDWANDLVKGIDNHA